MEQNPTLVEATQKLMASLSPRISGRDEEMSRTAASVRRCQRCRRRSYSSKVARSTLTPVRSIKASTAESGRSSVS